MFFEILIKFLKLKFLKKKKVFYPIIENSISSYIDFEYIITYDIKQNGEIRFR